MESIEIHLAEVLNQPACKPTLIEALISHIVSLRENGTPMLTVLESLENLLDDPHQANPEVIEIVMEWMLTNAKR